jgi:hypothetical protein
MSSVLVLHPQINQTNKYVVGMPFPTHSMSHSSEKTIGMHLLICVLEESSLSVANTNNVCYVFYSHSHLSIVAGVDL